MTHGDIKINFKYLFPSSLRNRSIANFIQIRKFQVIFYRSNDFFSVLLQGVWGDGEFTKLDDLIKTMTTFVYILTCVHAAANFNQYDEYGFAPNFPFRLMGLPPKNKVFYSMNDSISYKKKNSGTIYLQIVWSFKIVTNRLCWHSQKDIAIQYLVFCQNNVIFSTQMLPLYFF